MQVLISALCTPGRSLRQAIAKDARLADFGLQVDKKQEPARNPGWLKLHGTDKQRGAINVQWDTDGCVLSARVVTKGTTQPSPITGDFINYLFAQHSKRVRAITTAVVK